MRPPHVVVVVVIVFGGGGVGWRGLVEMVVGRALGKGWYRGLGLDLDLDRERWGE